MREKNDLHNDKTSNLSKPQDTVHTVCAWCFMLSGIFVVLCFFLKGTPRLLHDFSFYAAVVLGMGSIIVDRVNAFLKKSKHTKKEVQRMGKEVYHIDSGSNKVVKKKRLANRLFFVGLFFLFSGILFSLALFFVPDKYAKTVDIPALVLFVLFFIVVFIYNRVLHSIEKEDSNRNDV